MSGTGTTPLSFDDGFLEGQASRDEEVLALEARIRDLESDAESSGMASDGCRTCHRPWTECEC